MSDTPRTDAFANALLGGPAQTARYRNETEWRQFSRKLERELEWCKKLIQDQGNALNSEVAFLAATDLFLDGCILWDEPRPR